MSTLVTAPSHGLIADEPIYFGNIFPDNTGIIEGQTYYVLATDLTANEFRFAETVGGAAITLFVEIDDGNVSPVGSTVYTAITDPTDVMAPPPVPVTPTAPTLGSETISGLVRLSVLVSDTANEALRATEVQITHKFIDADPDWGAASVYTLPFTSTELTVPAIGSTVYAVRRRNQDVYGNFSAWSTHSSITTVAGSDALNAALADLANDVPDGIITETKIADNSISTPKLMAGAVTAEVLAATIVLASLLKTANTGRRVELDYSGITLFDTDESVLVRIPTNGDPVYVKGQIDANSLISQVSAEFRGVATLAASTIMTVNNGVAPPSAAPTIFAGLDSLLLTSTPADIATAAGIAYDSGAGTFWIAADPTAAGHFVAHEYNATTGVKVRSISATGSITTITATLGATSHVSDGANGRDGNTDSHFATPLTIPGGLTNVRITKVAVWLAGHNGSAACRTAVYSDVSGAGNALRESATFTAADKGATGTGDSILYDRTLSSELVVSSGSTYYFGARHTSSSEGFQWDFDSGSNKDTYLGDTANDADGTGWGLFSGSQKPNVYATYKYDVDTRLETAPMIGVATDGTHVYTLDTNGVIWKYLRSDGSYVANSAVQTAITGTKSKAGLFWDATASELIITTTTGTGAGVFPKFVRVDESTLAVSSTVYSAAAGTTFNGATDTFRGGARLNDPLNSNAATYWVATTSAVYAYTFSGTTATQTANRHFGSATGSGDGLTHDGTIFRGWDSAAPTKVWKFTDWDWTTASDVYWVCYAWYDSAGTTHETVVSPRSSVTMLRRQRLQVQNPSIPTGGADDPNQVRVYMLPNASNPSAGSFKLQVTDGLTSRFLTTYDSGGAADGGGTPFAAGTPAELKSAGTGWSLKGTGAINRTGTSFPASPATDDHFWRSDLDMEFFYDGTRWLSTTLYRATVDPLQTGAAATIGSERFNFKDLSGGSDIWLVDYDIIFHVAAGTALSGSHKWEGVMNKVRADGAGTTQLTTFTINSGANAQWRDDFGTVALDALLNNGTTYILIETIWTKTGTPGNLFVVPTLSYRIVAT